MMLPLSAHAITVLISLMTSEHLHHLIPGKEVHKSHISLWRMCYIADYLCPWVLGHHSTQREIGDGERKNEKGSPKAQVQT